ncbi:hypothetical protein FC093_01125 [Ilyomonas limi]|uniref:Uncharacterized protein n=1 Tax=Ilyomonas limi TaxID=2575867 RepID=A0A4U3LC60_9BACT|nr:hypothetical protein [Ilyomonas limi]TKK71656.1 hypothetical protein FC093_01125 [Ilyomonas limi]
MLLILALCFSLAKSQDDSTGYTLGNIQKYAGRIEQFLSTISSSIAGGQQQATMQQAENIKVYIDSIEAEMEYLPDEYYYRLSPLVSACRTDIEEFEKLVLNNAFSGKDKFITRAFNTLQQAQSSFRKALRSAYQTALQQPSGMDNKESNEAVEADSMPVVEQHSSASNSTAANSSHAVLVEAVDPTAITTSNNAPLLDTIYQSLQQIEQRINSIHLAMNKDKFGEMEAHAGSIANASLKISDLILLLKTDGKQNLFILATGLKNLSETLYGLTRKGTAAKDEMQQCINRLETKFSTLSTGIRLVQ